MSTEQLATADELAEQLRVSGETVRRWARGGRIPCIRPTQRTLRFDLAAVRQALEVVPNPITPKPAT